ncbi:MAG: Fe-S cluster-containing hydrogenase [Phycisphaeraceae bacterium]
MPSLNPELEGRTYWRSLAQRAAAESGHGCADLGDEFAAYEPPAAGGHTRRQFLSLMAAAMGLAGLTLPGCRRWPEQEVLPFASRPEGISPGEALWYATMIERDGVALGVLARSYDGRPIKLEGNPAHPDSLGAADALTQASILDLYDPDRSRAVLLRAAGQAQPRISSWDHFRTDLRQRLDALRAGPPGSRSGEGLVILSQVTASPTITRLREQFEQSWPGAVWRTFAPLHRDHEVQGSELAFGQPLRTQLDLAAAQVIACFDADLLGGHPSRQRLARGWSAGRDSGDQGRMNRLYVVESAMTLTGSVADHRLPLPPSQIAAAVAQLAGHLGVAAPAASLSPHPGGDRWIAQLASDLLAHQGQAVIAVGPAQPPAVHALAHAINQRLAAFGHAVRFTEEPDRGRAAPDLADAQQRIDAGQVHTLVMLGGNPVFDGGLKFTISDTAAGPGHVGAAIHLGTHYNESSAASTWHLPQAHELECWGDGRAWDGTISIQQPLILPLFGGRSVIELLAMLAGESATDGRLLVQQTLRPMIGGVDFDGAWRQALRDGVVAGSAWPTTRPGVTRAVPAEEFEERRKMNEERGGVVGSSARSSFFVPRSSPHVLEVLFIADSSVHDGRFANNGWLQEMPDPVTQLVWDNAALMSVTDTQRLGLALGDMVELQAGGRTLRMPVMIQPGVAAGTVVLPMGYGRRVVGRVGLGVGHDVYPLRPATQPYILALDMLRRTGERYDLVMTQEHHLIDAQGFRARAQRAGKPNESGLLIHDGTLDDYRGNQDLFQHKGHGIALKLFDPPHAFNEPHAWGMAIDLNKCIGCNACLVACQAENNVPIVGKQEVARHREMHWLRVDRYYKGDTENPQVVHQPLACVHCETAPCEQVCPVAATVHDSEGLNTMVYNRCIGTRYCSNNCPYKVRRFNYFDWHSRSPRTTGDTPPWLGIPDRQQAQRVDKLAAMVFNPEVTVRMRGVMEKCTYCTQRIQAARIGAKLEHAAGRRQEETVRDGEVVPACAGTCPTQAIVFGDLNDPKSKVSRLHANARAYGMLDDLLALRPRTQYLAKLRHPAVSGIKETHP